MAGIPKGDRRKARTDRPARHAPIVGLLFDPVSRPSIADVVKLADGGGKFAISHRSAEAGLAELVCDGLLFDCAGLGPGTPRRIDAPMQLVGLAQDFSVGDAALVTLAPGEQLAGVERSLPVLRILSWLVMALADLPGLAAIVWLPAGLAMSPIWFADAVGPWLTGGPFPGPALIALDRERDRLTSRGLGFFTGQEIVIEARDGEVQRSDLLLAIRLLDWLIATGWIDVPQSVDLPDYGAVDLTPQSADRLVAKVK